MNKPNNKLIAKNTLMLYIRMFLVMTVMLYTSRIVLKTLGVNDYGLYNVVGGIITLFATLNSMMSAASSRFITYELGRGNLLQLKKVFSTALTLHIALGGLIFIIAETGGLWFIMNKLIVPPERISAVFWVYQFSILSSLITITQIPYTAAILAHEKMNIYAYISILEVFLNLAVVGILVISTTDKLRLYAILQFCVIMIRAVTYRMYCKHNFIECTYYFPKDKTLYKKLLSYSSWDMIGSSSGVVQGQGINILLNMFFGPTVNAARAISMQVEMATMQFANNFLLATNPQIVKQYANNETESMMKLVFNSSKYGFFLILLIIVPLFIETPYILKLWLTDVPDYTIVFCRFTLLICIINVVKRPFVMALHATGHIKWGNIIGGTILLTAFPLTYICFKAGGSPVSFCYILFGTLLVNQIWDLYIVRQYVNFSIAKYVRTVIIKCILVAIIPIFLTSCIALVIETSFYRVCIVCLANTILTTVSLYHIGLTSNERKIVLNLLKQKITTWRK